LRPDTEHESPLLPAKGELPALSERVTSGVVPLDPESIVRLIGSTLRRLHDASVDQEAAEVSLRARRELLDAQELRPTGEGPYGGRSGAELLAIFDRQLAELGESTEPSVVHGALTLDRCWAAPTGELYFTEWARSGAGDRHLDIAAIAADIADHFGPAAVAPLIDAYGFEHVRPARLDMCQLLNHLVESAQTETSDGAP